MSATIETLLTAFVCLGLTVIVILWVYFDLRERQLYSLKRTLHAFHCVKCGHIYGVRQSRTVANCPKCSFRNTKLSF